MAAVAGIALDPLIGREDDLEAVLDLLAANRLVTLTGPGGSGKTRLAQAAVDALRATGRDAWFVDASGIDHADLLAPTMAATLGLLGGPAGDPLELLVARLSARPAVLALDNLEQIGGAGRTIAQLLEALPELAVLATSRKPLRVRGEREFQVVPLGLPSDASPAAVASSPAGQLFLRRAGALGKAPAGAAGAMDEARAKDLALLLRRLDGVPLAIELAAARARILSPAEINRRIDERGPDAIDLDGRDDHRSLRSILDWTVSQLSTFEADTLEALSVCAGFDLALAEALLPDHDVVPAIEALVELGLVQRAPAVAGVSRFRLLAPIQELLARRLDEAATQRYRTRLADHIRRVAESWDRRKLSETRDLPALFEVEADNVRRALDHLETAEPRAALALMASLRRFWAGRAADGYQRFLRMRRAAPGPSTELSRAAIELLQALWITISISETIRLEDWILDAARSLADDVLLEEALRQRSMGAMAVADITTLRAIEAELDRIAPRDDRASQIRRLHILTNAERVKSGKASATSLEMQQALYAAMKDAGDDMALGIATDLAGLHFMRGEFRDAASVAEEASHAYKELGREEYAAWALAWRVAALAEDGRGPEAYDELVVLVAAASKVRHTENLSNTLWAGMPVALALDRAEMAARCYGAFILGMVKRDGYVPAPEDLATAEDWLQRARRRADQVSIELALRQGERDAPPELVALLPELLRGAAASAGSAAPRSVVRHGQLTRREVEILGLVGRGRSDQEIAAELFISPKTASVHVSNIKGKLGVESRLEMALRARELGLVESAGEGARG